MLSKWTWTWTDGQALTIWLADILYVSSKPFKLLKTAHFHFPVSFRFSEYIRVSLPVNPINFHIGQLPKRQPYRVLLSVVHANISPTLRTEDSLWSNLTLNCTWVKPTECLSQPQFTLIKSSEGYWARSILNSTYRTVTDENLFRLDVR